MEDFVVVRLEQGEHFPLEGTLNFKIIWGKQYAKLGPIRSSDRKVTILEDAAFRTSSQDARILQRIPPRIKCFYTATDNQRYQLGEVKVALSDQNISMQQLLKFQNVAGSTFKEPSLLVSTFFERSAENASAESVAVDDLARPATILTPEPAADANVDDGLLVPVLVDDEYFQIGNPSDEQNFYTLSVTISFAENLVNLFPSDRLWPPPKDSPCQFQFNLLGSTITFSQIKQLSGTLQVGEQATARIRSTPACLLEFLKTMMPELRIYLIFEALPIAEAVIPIKERIEMNRMELHFLRRLRMEPANISGVFRFKSLLEAPETDDTVHSTQLKPSLGVLFIVSQLWNYTPSSPQDAQLPSTSTAPPNNNMSEKFHEHPSVSANILSLMNPELDKMTYAAALELEVWKDQQKMMEQEKQEMSRTAYLETLNSEYRRQISIKESAFERRVRQVEGLERQLESVIQSAREYEKELQRQKEVLSRQEAQLAREKRQVSAEVEKVTQDLLRKHKFELEAERRRYSRNRCKDAKRIAELEEELRKIKANQVGLES